MYKKAFGLTLTFLILTIVSWAQDVSVHGEFHQDSVKIGVPIPYSLTANYPRNLNIIFPDSLFDFSPFEYERRVYYTTHSDSILSFDSVVYFLSTFEIDSIQKLSLPVFQVNNSDTSTYTAIQDSVILIELIKQMPDSVQLKENTAYLTIPLQFNYPYFLLGTAILIVLIIIIILVFGKRIQKAWQTRKLNRRFEKYVVEHDQAVDQVKSSITINGANSIVQIWKRYLEKLEKKPYTKLTTKEISEIYGSEKELITILRTIDGLIYGGKSIHNVSFDMLKNFAKSRNENKKVEVKNG